MDPSTHGIRGLASVFGNLDSYDTIVDRGAFAREVAAFHSGQTLPLVSRHAILRDPSAEPIGVVTHMEELQAGLYFEASADDTEAGREALTRAASGSSSGASFSFRPLRTYDEHGRRVVRRSALYEGLGLGPFWDGGGRDIWSEWAARGEDGTDHDRLVLPTREAMAMVKAAKRVKGYDADPIFKPLRVLKIEHIADLSGMKELGPCPARLGANPRAYAEAFDLAEATETGNHAAPMAAGNLIAGALASAAQEIAS